MITGSEFLRADVIDSYVPMFTDPRNQPTPLRLLARTPMTPAVDGEILFRMLNRVLLADVVMDDQKAITYRQQRVQAQTTTIPRLKVGSILTEEDLARLSAIRDGASGNSTAVREVVDNMLPQLVKNVVTGVMQRIETFCVAMYTDSFTYNRYGIKITGGTFGMPAALNVIVSNYWTDSANATPVNDILALKQQSLIQYGMDYNRITMSSQAFRYMIACTEFQNKTRTTLPLFINAGNIPLQNVQFWQTVAKSILNVDEIEFYDQRVFSEDSSGNTTNAPAWPPAKVVLSSTQYDNNAGVMDVGNAVTVESMLRPFLATEGGPILGNLPDGMRGPISYVTVPYDLNPGNLTIWAAARAFPRKKLPWATASLTVGTFVDQFPTTDPFI